MSYDLTIRGLQQAQQGMLRAVRAVKPEGGLGRAVLFLSTGTHRYLVSVTHVDTGAYRASQMIEYTGAASMRISVNQSARNPRSRALVAGYAAVEEARGGSHSAYDRSFEYARANLAPRAGAMLASEAGL